MWKLLLCINPIKCMIRNRSLFSPLKHDYNTNFYNVKQNLLNIMLAQHIITPRINTHAYSLYPKVIKAWNLLHQKSYAYQHYTHSNKSSIPSTFLHQPTSPDSSLTLDTVLICTNYYTCLLLIHLSFCYFFSKVTFMFMHPQHWALHCTA